MFRQLLRNNSTCFGVIFASRLCLARVHRAMEGAAPREPLSAAGRDGKNSFGLVATPPIVAALDAIAAVVANLETVRLAVATVFAAHALAPVALELAVAFLGPLQIAAVFALLFGILVFLTSPLGCGWFSLCCGCDALCWGACWAQIFPRDTGCGRPLGAKTEVFARDALIWWALVEAEIFACDALVRRALVEAKIFTRDALVWRALVKAKIFACDAEVGRRRIVSDDAARCDPAGYRLGCACGRLNVAKADGLSFTC